MMTVLGYLGPPFAPGHITYCLLTYSTRHTSAAYPVRGVWLPRPRDVRARTTKRKASKVYRQRGRDWKYLRSFSESRIRHAASISCHISTWHHSPSPLSHFGVCSRYGNVGAQPSPCRSHFAVFSRLLCISSTLACVPEAPSAGR